MPDTIREQFWELRRRLHELKRALVTALEHLALYLGLRIFHD